MNINIKIEYDNSDQYLDTRDLPKYLFKRIKNRGNEKLNVNLSIEHRLSLIDHGKINPNVILIPSIYSVQNNQNGIPFI